MVEALIYQIVKLFIILFVGVLIVRMKLMKSEETKPLSNMVLYILSPCTILVSFQVAFTREVMLSLTAAFIMSAVSFAVFLVTASLYKRFFNASQIERGSVIYPNCGNMLIPIITALLGPEYVIYISPMLVIYNFLFWTHAISMFENEDGNKHIRIDWMKIIKNPNMIAIAVGLILLVCHVEIGGVVRDAMDSICGMIGPISMIVTGMILGGMPFRDMFRNHRIFGVMFVRMIFIPVVLVLLLRITGAVHLIPHGHEVFLVVLLGASAPSGSMINMLAILYKKDARYASCINVFTTLAALLTMPAVTWLYELLV